MTRKKWALLILCILLTAGYFKFFFKTFSVSAVPKNADCIIAVDVKRITNTVIWNTLTTPSQWKKISFSSSGGINWKDMFRIPDYIFIFHTAGQPTNAWYTVLEIKDKEDFGKGLVKYHFEIKEKTGSLQEYMSAEFGISMIRYGNKVMIANLAVQDKNYSLSTATELFIQQQYTTKETLRKNTETSSHISMQINDDRYLGKTAIIKANFDKKKLVIDGYFDLQKQFIFTEHEFNYSDSALSSIGFTQPPAALYKLLSDTSKAKISNLLNTNIDSLLLENNHHYSLDIAGIYPRTDTAISYTYDADFNPVENKVVNNVLEPAFNFMINGENIALTYNYWKTNDKLEETSSGELFLPMPFVRSYCKKNSEKELAIVSNNYQPPASKISLKSVFFLNLVFDKIPTVLKRYFPAGLENAVKNIESARLTVTKENKTIVLHGLFNKKKNDIPIIGL